MNICKTALIAFSLLALGACGGSDDDSTDWSNKSPDLFKDVPFSSTKEGKAIMDVLANNKAEMVVKTAFEATGQKHEENSKMTVGNFKKGELQNVGPITLLSDKSKRNLSVYKGDYGLTAMAYDGKDISYVGGVFSSSFVNPEILSKYKSLGKVAQYKGKAFSADGTIYGDLDYTVDFGKMDGSGKLSVSAPGDVKTINLLSTKLKDKDAAINLENQTGVEILDGDGKTLERNGSYYMAVRGHYGELIDGGLLIQNADDKEELDSKYLYGERSN